jgi:hypothetical protein
MNHVNTLVTQKYDSDFTAYYKNFCEQYICISYIKNTKIKPF